MILLKKNCKEDFVKEFKTNNGVIVKLHIFYHIKEDRFYMTYLDKDLNDYSNIGSLTSNTQSSGALKSINVYKGTNIAELYKKDKDLIKILPV